MRREDMAHGGKWGVDTGGVGHQLKAQGFEGLGERRVD